MARSKEQRLGDVTAHAKKLDQALAIASANDAGLTRAMVRARRAGLSLRAIGAAADMSDVAVLQRTRVYMDAKS